MTMPAPPKARMMGAREWLLLILLSFLWGCSFYFFKILVAEPPPISIVLGRVALAAALLNLLNVGNRASITKLPRMWSSFVILGLLNNIVPMTLIASAESRISSGQASILNATTPVFAVLAAHFWMRTETLDWQRGIGVLCGFLGVVMLIGPSMLAITGGNSMLGQGLSLGAALSYALAGIYARRFGGVGMSSLTVAAGQLTASTLVLIPMALIVDKPWTLCNPSVHAWEALIGLAILSTALAYVIYFRILATAGATNVLLVTFLSPISAILLGVLFLNETINAPSIAGMALIGAGLAAIDGRLPSAVRRYIFN